MSRAPSLKATRVLVVDDDPMFTEMVLTCLAGAGYEVSAASDGVEAMHLLEQKEFDLAMVDLIMPNVDGFRLIALIRATPQIQDLPILVISSRHDVRAFEEALTVGANAFLTKPITWALLPTQLRYVLAQRRGTEKNAGVPAGSAAPAPELRGLVHKHP